MSSSSLCARCCLDVCVNNKYIFDISNWLNGDVQLCHVPSVRYTLILAELLNYKRFWHFHIRIARFNAHFWIVSAVWMVDCDCKSVFRLVRRCSQTWKLSEQTQWRRTRYSLPARHIWWSCRCCFIWISCRSIAVSHLMFALICAFVCPLHRLIQIFHISVGTKTPHSFHRSNSRWKGSSADMLSESKTTFLLHEIENQRNVYCLFILLIWAHEKLSQYAVTIKKINYGTQSSGPGILKLNVHFHWFVGWRCTVFGRQSICKRTLAPRGHRLRAKSSRW